MKTIEAVRMGVVSAWVLFGEAGVLAAATMPPGPGIWCDRRSAQAVRPRHEDRLVQSLRRITGLAGVHFTAAGSLAVGDTTAPPSGAPSAREVLLRALRGPAAYVIEDHSESEAVRFGQLDEGTHYVDPDRELFVWRVRLDFEDFDRLQASPEVREAFDPGFVLLHELLHGLGHRDASHPDGIGEVEDTLNQARAELGVPLRTQYFGEARPLGSGLFTVRLRFQAGKRTRYAAFLIDGRRTEAAVAKPGAAAIAARTRGALLGSPLPCHALP